MLVSAGQPCQRGAPGQQVVVHRLPRLRRILRAQGLEDFAVLL